MSTKSQFITLYVFNKEEAYDYAIKNNVNVVVCTMWVNEAIKKYMS